MLELHEHIFRARALAQTHPFSSRCYRYLNRAVTEQREKQPVPELGVWAGHALTAGYCLRRVEEMDTGRSLTGPDPDLPDDLQAAAERVAEALRTDGGERFVLYPEERVVEVLDLMIAGEIERRLQQLEEVVDPETFTQLEDYLASWVILGYALRVADELLPAETPA